MAGRLIFFLLVAIPLIEIAVLIQVGGQIGLVPTLAAIILTALVGVSLLRQQGTGVLHRARADIDAGIMPVDALFDGACLLVAGVCLLTPGFVTDALGFALLVPAVRNRIAAWLGTRAALRRGNPGVVDGSFVRVDESEAGPAGDSDRTLPPDRP